MTPPRAVIWDMGGIVYPTPFELFDEVESARGLPVGTLPRGPFADPPDPDYQAVDRGELPEPVYWQRLIDRLAASGTRFDVHHDLDWPDRERPAVMAAIAELGTALPQVMLTNDATAFLGSGWAGRWPYAHLFAAVVDSVEVGVRKPDPRAYHAAAQAVGLSPGECLFVDDLAVNVTASRDAGMPAVRFDVTNVRDSIAAIRAAVRVAD